MELNKNSWSNKLYMRAYNISDWTSLPNNFCGYFWKLMFLLVTLPLSWPMMLHRLDRPVYGVRLFLGTVLQLMFAVYIYAWIHNPGKALFLTGTIIGIMVAIASVVAALIYFDRHPIRVKQPEIVRVVGEGFSSFKGKYCPKITWK